MIDAAYAEYVNRNDYDRRHRAGRPPRQRRDDAHLLEDLRPRRAAARLGLLSRRRSPTCSTGCAGRSTSTSRRSSPASPPWRTPKHVEASQAHNAAVAALARPTTLGGLGLTAHPSRRQLRAGAVSPTRLRAEAAVQLPAQPGHHHPQLVGSYGLPDCLRITVGLEREMRALADALGEHLERT